MDRKIGWFEGLLRRVFPHKEIGWKEIEEEFVRFTLLSTPWFVVMLHRLDARILHHRCHDHPWSFLTLLVKGGYIEHTEEGIFRRRPGTVLYRPATFRHNVVTERPSWSLLIRTPKKRQWQHVDCRTRTDP